MMMMMMMMLMMMITTIIIVSDNTGYVCQLNMKKKKTNSTAPNLYQQQREFLNAPQNQYVRCVKYDFLFLTEDKDKRIRIRVQRKSVLQHAIRAS